MNKLVYIINNRKKNSTNEEIKNEIQLKANEIDNTNIVKITCKPTNTTSDYVSLQMKMPILTHDGPYDIIVIGEKPFYRVSPVYNQEFLGIESETKNQIIILHGFLQNSEIIMMKNLIKKILNIFHNITI